MGTVIDEDLRRLIDGGLRRIRRVLSSRRAREVLVEVVEIVEDEHEFGIVMLDPGSPLRGSPRQVQARRQSCMTNTGRRNFWRNVYRVVEALTHCHDAGIVHGALNESSIFVGDDRSPSYKLGGYEACIHIAGEDLPLSEMAFRTSDPVSFRQDLADLAKVVRSVLGLGQPDEPVLMGIEQRMLARMSDPPHFQLYDGHVALEELAEVVEELGRLGTSIEGELVLYPVRDVLRSDLPTLASGAIPADDTDAVLRFVADDLLGQDTRAVVDAQMVRVVTDLAVYRIEIVDDRIGMIVRGTKRQPHDAVADAFEIKRRIYLARNRGAAAERVRKLGNGALPWASLGQTPSPATFDDPPTWHALILLETFSLLKQQFKAFPVDVLAPPPGRSELVWVAPRSDAETDARRKRLKLPPSPVARSPRAGDGPRRGASGLDRIIRRHVGAAAGAASRTLAGGDRRGRRPTRVRLQVERAGPPNAAHVPASPYRRGHRGRDPPPVTERRRREGERRAA
jgi:hypothetical protein